MQTQVQEQALTIGKQESTIGKQKSTIGKQESTIEKQTSDLSLQNNVVQEQAHSVLELESDNDRLQKQNAELELKVEKLLRQLFGRRSERRVDGEGQLYLDLGDEATPEVVNALEEAIREAEQTVDEAAREKQKRKQQRPGKTDRKFPDHLPRTEKIVDLPEEQREGLKLIGYDEVEMLKWKRPELYVELTKYAKYVFPAGQTPADETPSIETPVIETPAVENPSGRRPAVISPERPSGLAGNRFDVSIAAEIVAWKYAYHLPFYRQQDLFAGSGWTPSRSTLANLETEVAFTLEPLADYLRSFLKTDRCIGCDDTGVTLVTPKSLPDLSNHPRGDRISKVLGQAIEKGKPSIKANYWGYYASRLPVVAFDFTVSRHRDGPDDVLEDFSGTLIGDCWSGFQKINFRSVGRITFAACWAHARRKIDECRSSFPTQVSNLESLIRMLYDIEDQIKTLDDDTRLSRRQSLSRHVLGSIDNYLHSPEMHPSKVLPKSNLAQAAAYVRRHWKALNQFTDDASIPIDNNDCEQLMKRVATGRKNWLFKGSLAAGERSANLMTIIGTALRNDLDIHAYLSDVLQQTLAGETDWSKLAPHHWKQTHPESIRQYRQEERRQAADRNRTRRANRRKATQPQQK